MAAKKRGGKKASKATSKKRATRAGSPAAGGKKVGKKAGKKKAGKKKKKKASKKARAAAPVGKKARAAKKRAGKKRPGKKRASRRSAAAASEAMEGQDDGGDDAGGGGDDEGGDDDEPDDIDVGSKAPAFELTDQHGKRLSSAELAGNPYVLYFYPKDDTPGCTTEACGFRDRLPELEAAGVTVLGVSPDGTASHKRFSDKYGLGFRLLSDPDKTLARAYGVWVMKKNYGREYMGIERSTFLVGADGRLARVWRRVRVNGHVDAVRDAAASL